MKRQATSTPKNREKKFKTQPRNVSFINPPSHRISTIEQKDQTFSTGLSVAASTSTASVTLLNGIAVGNTAGTRVGRGVQMKSLQFRSNCSQASGFTAGQVLHRILIVYDKQTNGLAPLATDVMESDNFYGYMNLNNSKRFVVISDNIIEPDNLTNYKSKVFRKLNLPIEFNSVGGAFVSSITTGSIYVLSWVFCTQASAPTFQFNSRIRYTDM